MKYESIAITPPTVEPVTLKQANNQLRLELGDDNDQVEVLIKASRDRAEKFCNRFFTEQTIAIVYDGVFSGTTLCLPYPDLQSITAIKTYDAEGNETTLDPGDYNFVPSQKRIYFSTVPSDYATFTVEVLTGAPAEFEGAKQAILMMLTDMYETRTEYVDYTINENKAVMSALYPYRVNIGV
jgi:uncharacterized phiE125 gp8 family phage protein